MTATGEAISYEAARDELLDVVRQLEAGGLPLETSLTLWERGEQLAAQCQSWLDGAKQRLAAKRPDATADASADAREDDAEDEVE
jgi:exodeoxyribonuclease VII small subunit